MKYPPGQDALQDLRNYIEETENQDDFFLSNLLHTLEIIRETSHVHADNFTSFFYLRVADSRQLRYFSEQLLFSPIFLTCRFFDLSYNLDILSQTKLSSGELEMLNLLSRIYWYLTIEVEKFANLKVPAMLFLDEAEIGFHPEWQRKYLWIITGFLRIFSENRSSQATVPPQRMQIIYTTHSPITLGDLPRECVNFLEKEGKRVFNRTAGMPQTFGENVFELYRHSFFMKDGLLGKMAEEYIRNISDALHPGFEKTKSRNELKKRIDLVGDRRIRNYLLERYAKLVDENDLDSRIALKERELEQLKRLKRERQSRNEKN